jgi:hypothetical protein
MLRTRVIAVLAGLACLARAETYCLPASGLPALLGATREEALSRLGPPVSAPPSAEAPGYYVEYRHLQLTYRVGPCLGLAEAERVRQTLLGARAKRLAMEPNKYRFSEVRLFRVNASNQPGAGITTKSKSTEGDSP